MDSASGGIEDNLPNVVRGLFDQYKRHAPVLIKLVSEVAELQHEEIYTFDHVLFRASLIFLQQYYDQYPDIDLRSAHSFLILVFTSSVREYLSLRNPKLREDEFVKRLSDLLVGYLVGASSRPLTQDSQ